MRTALEGLVDEAKDVQLAREERQSQVQAAKHRLSVAANRKSKLFDQLEDMRSLEKEMEHMIENKQDEVKQIMQSRTTLLRDCDASLSKVEDGFLSVMQERAALIERIGVQMQAFQQALADALKCSVCNKLLDTPVTVVETGEPVCKACVPKYMKNTAVERLRLENAGLVGPSSSTSTAGAFPHFADPSHGGSDPNNNSSTDSPFTDVAALVAPRALVPLDEPWIESYIRQAPPAGWNPANKFRPFMPQIQLDPVSQAFKERLGMYDSTVMTLLDHCKIMPTLVRSYMAARKKRKGAAESAAAAAAAATTTSSAAGVAGLRR